MGEEERQAGSDVSGRANLGPGERARERGVESRVQTGHGLVLVGGWSVGGWLVVLVLWFERLSALVRDHVFLDRGYQFIRGRRHNSFKMDDGAGG